LPVNRMTPSVHWRQIFFPQTLLMRKKKILPSASKAALNQEALEMHQKALEIRIKVFNGHDHIDVAKTMNNLGIVYMDLPALSCLHGPPALSCFHGPACTASFVHRLFRPGCRRPCRCRRNRRRSGVTLSQSIVEMRRRCGDDPDRSQQILKRKWCLMRAPDIQDRRRYLRRV
jgi:hypothetical protein